MHKLYIMDNRVPSRDDVFNSIPASQVVIMALEQDAIPDIVDVAFNNVRSRFGLHSISTLTILAHGLPGFVQLGTGLTSANATLLSPLRALLRPGTMRSRCVLFGCYMGAANRIVDPITGDTIGDMSTGWGIADTRLNYTGGPGYQLLYSIARSLGVSVAASLDEQHSDHALFGFRFEGPVLTVQPSGEFTLAEGSNVYLDSRFM